MGKKDIKKFLIYLFRWQMSTPIIWLVVRNLGTGLMATIIANFIGGCIFFWIDKIIFKSNHPKLSYIKKGKCDCCHQSNDLYCLATESKLLCTECSLQNLKKLNIRSIKINY